jgi:dTDP-4-amino-4,6-dideoxygalactose transaminase
VEGYNGRLDAIQAGILRIKLRHLEQWNEQRRDVAARYDDLLASAEPTLKRPYVPSWARPVYHLYVVGTQQREELQKHLAGSKIGTGIHYPIPLHLQKAYRHLGYQAGAFPISEQGALEILSLPMFPGLEREQQHTIAEAVLAFMSSKPVRAFAAGASSFAD